MNVGGSRSSTYGIYGASPKGANLARFLPVAFRGRRNPFFGLTAALEKEALAVRYTLSTLVPLSLRAC